MKRKRRVGPRAGARDLFNRVLSDLWRLAQDVRELAACCILGAKPREPSAQAPPVRATPPEPAAPQQSVAAPQGPDRLAEASALLALLSDLATGLWRIKRRIPREGNGEPPNEMRAVYRHAEAAEDALRASGVEVCDHTRKPYVTGMALKVIAFQPTAGVSTEYVDETVKPSIYFRDRLIQRGEVIVAVPSKGDT